MTSTGPRPGHPTEAELADAIERHGGRLDESQGQPRWWITDPSSAAEDTAAHIGLAEHRRLFQMRRPLPLDLTPVDDAEPPPTLDTRAFDPDRDADTWLAINNAAFSWHPEQGGWTRETLEARMAEPWFDLDDFRIADLDGTMAGFCWTKVHPETATEPRLGEIYVIAVAPARVGTGLGTALWVLVPLGVAIAVLAPVIIGFGLLGLSYGQTSEAEPRRRRFLLSEVCQEVRDLLHLNHEAGIEFVDTVAADIEVDADSEQLFRVIHNICRNAVQALATFTPEDPDHVRRITVSAQRTGSVVAIVIDDTGPGMPRKARENLFTAFRGSARSGGTGLGLAIARELVIAHGGTIALVEKPGPGTMFRVEIPDRPVALDDWRARA